MAIPSFIDQAVLTVSAGNGGNGCASIHREKFKPLGGPDGGNGGNGGSVIIRVDPNLTTLVEFHRQSIRRAANGKPGLGDFNNGANGEDIVLNVPDGTVISDAETGVVLADLVGPEAEVVVAAGGRGGLGNAALASQSRKAPGFALLGEEGSARQITLELKVVADIGLVGFPSAGKSSLIAAISRARPKIADYPFTTLIPNLGVIVAGDTTFTVADVPGLIEGASEGRGLGHDFLRHIERCQAIVHVIDCATYEPGRDPLTDLDIIEAELTAHGGLEDRPRMVALNKIDVPDGGELAEIVAEDIRARGLQVFANLHQERRRAAGADLRDGRPGRRAGGQRPPRWPRRRSSSAPNRSRPDPSSPSPARATARAASCGASAATSPSAGCARPTSTTPRPSATSPTGSPGWASRRSCWRWVPSPGTPSRSVPTTRSSSTSPRRWRSVRRSSPVVARTTAWSVTVRPPSAAG